MSINLGPAGPAPSTAEKTQMRTAIGAMGRVANTAAGFAAANTVLLADQFGVETDTGKFKVGDGATAWNSLPYATAADVGDLTTAGLTEGSFLRVAAGGGLEEVELIITRTAAEGSPSSDHTLTITGSMLTGAAEPVPVPTVLTRVADVGGYPQFEGDNSSTFGQVGGVFQLSIGGGQYVATHPLLEIQDFDDLEISENWTVTVGTTTPTVANDRLAPAFLGQKCIVGDDSPGNGNRLEFTSLDGVTWTLTGPPNVRASTDTPGSIIVETWASDVPTWTLTTIEDYLTA